MTTHNESKSVNFYPNCDVSVWLRSCTNEILEPLQGTTSGVIPQWLQGTLLRNGPGSIKVGTESFKHLFDSSALLHRFHIKNGTATYQCRFLQSEVFKRNQAANRIVFTEFGTRGVPDPCRTIFQRVAAIFNPNEASDNSMISVYPFGDKVYALGEIPIMHQINPATLEVEKRVNVGDFVSIVHHTSHPHITSDGNIYNMGLTNTVTGPYHTIVKFPKQFDGAKIVAGIPARWKLNPSYMHTFGITENYFIIVEQPLNISITKLVTNKFKNEPLAGCFQWNQNEKTQINLIRRDTGDLAFTFFTEAFFFLHIINQYEMEDVVILDICTYKDPSMLDCMYIKTMENMQQNENYAEMFRSKPLRFVLPLSPEKSVIQERLIHLGCETPRINYNFLGRKYRYFYAISADVDAANPGTIIKVDTVTKTARTWCENNCYPSEPIFVPTPNHQDDGIVLAAMVWGGCCTNKVGLIVLNAVDLTEMGRVEFETPGPVPKCLHGWFLTN